MSVGPLPGASVVEAGMRKMPGFAISAGAAMDATRQRMGRFCYGIAWKGFFFRRFGSATVINRGLYG